MIKTLKFYMKMLYKILTKETITSEEYREEYDKIAKTYSSWLEQMGKHTDKIIKPKYVSEVSKPKVLDFACGTGYISKMLLLDENMNFDITAVDISKEMLSEFDKTPKENLRIVNSDGIIFLNTTEEKYDAIYCGWALPYFNHNELLKLFKDRLNANGIVSVISNSKGTLGKMENIFLNVMKENQDQIVKPMDIRFNLPNGKKELIKWFEKYGFVPLELEEKEVIFSFDTAKDLHNWVVKTGAIAGTAKIFKDYNAIEENIIKEIEKEKLENGNYTINHKFIYGIFRIG